MDRKEFHLDEIDLVSLLKDLLRNVYLMVLMAASALMLVTSVNTLTYRPMYTTTAMLAVNSKSGSSTYSSLTLTSQMAEVLSEVFQSDVLKRKVAEELEMPVEELNGSIRASILTETNLIQLTVTSDTSRKAYLMMQAALHNYDSVSDYLFSNAVLRVLKEPVVPYYPSNVRNISRYQKLAMAAGVFAVAAVVILFSVLRFTVKTAAGAERQLEGKMLGLIPYERRRIFHNKKHKQAPLISTSLTSLYFKEAVRKTATRTINHLQRHQGKVLLVTSITENEGKSSVAINLALAMAEKRQRVLLIDLDLKKPAQYKIKNQPLTSGVWLSDVLQGKKALTDAIYYEKETGLSYLFQKSAMKGSSKLINTPQFRQLLSQCRNRYDMVLVDTPPMALASTTEEMLSEMDSTLLVIRQDVADIRAINDAVDQIRKSGTKYAGYVLNAFVSGSSLPREHYGHYEHH